MGKNTLLPPTNLKKLDNMTERNKERLAENIERLKNTLGAIQLPMPDGFHLEQLKEILPEIMASLQEIYVDEAKENPWEHKTETH